MAIEVRSIRCHYFRVTREPCMKPAVVEVSGPYPKLVCAEHAAYELETEPGFAHQEGWEEFGIEAYARYCEQAVSEMHELKRANGADEMSPENPVLEMALEEAITYLEEYELDRARRALERLGGARETTSRERAFAEGFEKAKAALTRKPDDVLSEINGHLTAAAELLSESYLHREEDAEEERKATHAIAEAGTIIVRLSNQSQREGRAGPENGGAASA